MVEIKLIKMTNITPNLQILLNRETRKRPRQVIAHLKQTKGLTSYKHVSFVNMSKI